MSGRLIITLFTLAFATHSAAAQQASVWGGAGGPVASEYGILDNSIANLQAVGDSLWVGPYLNLTVDGGATWLVAGTDSLFGTGNRIYSLDADGETVVVGLGRSDRTEGDAVQTAAGFLVSSDGGETYEYRFPQLDAPEDDTEIYGANVLAALPVIVPQQSPPFDIDWDATTGTIWVAGWASGIRRSDDFGLTWHRVVLPPDELTEIEPGGTYDFVVEPQRGGTGELNHMGFSVLVDEAGTVWAGTPIGINRSLDGGLSWNRTGVDAAPRGLISGWVISIEEQPLPGRNPVWVAAWNSGSAGGDGEFGVSVTRDGGVTWEHALHGERVYDFAFRGDVVYAAGENGLFRSSDGGRTWISTTAFVDATDVNRFVRPGASVYSVETTRTAVWVGTEDGLLKSLDGGATWRLFRVEVPLHPQEPTDEAPDVDTYAYPNPFAPSIDQYVRIRFETASGGSARLRIFDGSMSLVRVIEETRLKGTHEFVWDGMDDRGTRVANGVYFYDIGGSVAGTVRGKILVIE